MRNALLTVVAASVPLAWAHIEFADPSMWGYDVHAETFPYDNRPETPLQQYTFKQWWFHGHLDYPPAAGKFFELPAGGTAMAQLACNKGATKWWADSEGTTDIRQGDYPCPGYPLSQFHGHEDLKGCALSIAYTSDVNNIKPEDLAIFSVNHECVWKVNTPFQIPKDMPACPEGGCICAWHWIHSVDSGSAQMYMNGFRCKVTGSTSNTPVSKPVVPKRCTGDLSKCNQGAQQPMYWFQAEGNNMFNDQYDPPYYLDDWGFTDGAQNGIFGKRDDTPTTPTPTDKPTTTTNTPSSTPAGNKPESTPGDQPTPAPGNSPGNSNGGNGGNQGNGENQKPPPSPSPSPSPPPKSPDNSVNNPPANPPGDVKDNTSTNTASPHLPSPSRKPCKKRNKKRQELVSRHFKHKRHHARSH